MLEVNTFSIVGHCSTSGMLGAAVSTAVPAAAGLCIFIKSGVGAIATQSWINPYLGIDGLQMLATGETAESVCERLIRADPGAPDRQVGIVDAHGRSDAYTGARCVEWAGHLCGEGFSVQGNMLAREATLWAMCETAENNRSLSLPDRLMRSLEAGQTAGGDRRGKQSAALKVFAAEEYPLIDIRVDDHPDPVVELRRIFEVAKRQLLPFVEGMPTRRDPIGFVSADVIEMLLKEPSKR
jgi:uncharacterized Ntn-hydrolase superfamily protein